MNCQRGRIVLSYPAVLSEVKGETPVKFSLSGKREKVSVRSVKAGEKGLYDALLFELLPDENGEADSMLENAVENNMELHAEVTLAEDGRLIYQSSALPPGGQVLSAPLLTKLEAGEHEAHAMLWAHDPESGETVGQASVVLTITVKEVTPVP